MQDQSADVLRKAVASATETLRGLEDLEAAVTRAAKLIVDCLRDGKKLLVCGNGGSAADSQHLAAELVGRFALERRALPAMALSVNSSVVTAIGNDYGYEQVFSRQLEGLARAGDMAIGITTSGNSANVIRAMESGSAMGLRTIAMTGARGGQIRAAVDECLCVPSDLTPRIQEGHILIGHMLCEYAERDLFGK